MSSTLRKVLIIMFIFDIQFWHYQEVDALKLHRHKKRQIGKTFIYSCNFLFSFFFPLSLFFIHFILFEKYTFKKLTIYFPSVGSLSALRAEGGWCDPSQRHTKHDKLPDALLALRMYKGKTVFSQRKKRKALVALDTL